MSAADIEAMKEKAALRALDFVQSGMKLGLGTGSTARYFVDGLGRKVADGLDVLCVPTSEATRTQAQALNIPLTQLDAIDGLDLTIDGADELDEELTLIKGGGGALLCEKIVASASRRMLVIADSRKRVKTLGAFPLPVEVAPFAHSSTARAIKTALAACGVSGAPVLRGGDTPFITDSGHYIYDCPPMQIEDAPALARALAAIAGVMEHGLFIGLANAALLADADGIAEIGAL